MDHDIPAQTAAGESGAMEPAAAEGPSVKCRLYEWPLGHEGTNDIDDIGASTHRPAIEEPKIRTGAELTRARKHLSSAHHSILIIISALFSITFSNTSHAIQQQQNWTTSLGPAQLPFGSTRYVYPLSNHPSPTRNNNNNHRRQLLNSHYRYDILSVSDENETSQQQQLEKPSQVEIVALRNQLLDMRKKFEIQLAASSGRRQVALGSPCLTSKDCSVRVENSHCRIDNYTCSCLANHVEYNSTTCLPSALLGFKCSIDSQCEQRVANSFCSSDQQQQQKSDDNSRGTSDPMQHRICSCKSNFIAYRRDKCLPGSPINEYCLSNEQCRLNDRHSYCQWRITNIYGTCKCPPNYKQLYVGQQSTGGGEIKCVPRLGDVCLSDDECHLGTPNSACREITNAASEDHQQQQQQQQRRTGGGQPSFRWIGSWKSSQATSSQGRRCLCQSGFVPSTNKLECLTWPNSSPSNSQNKSEPKSDSKPTTSVAATESSITIITLNDHPDTTKSTADNKRQPQYDLVINPPSGAPTTTPTPEASRTTTTTTTTSGPTVVSSLGKKCSSSRECQARDPYSDCIGGICECLRPTSKCRASRTGCHEDTFQCRNGQCISWYFVCDQFRNCADGSDEDECQWAECPPEAFQCSSGQCLARSKVCNGQRDCQDGTDELHCSTSIAQSTGASNMNGTTSTITGGRHHHHHHHHHHQGEVADWLSPGASIAAALASKNATTTKDGDRGGCHPKAFTCTNGQCLPGYVFCNAVQDCSDGSDEREHFCESRTYRATTNESQTRGSTEAAQAKEEEDNDSSSLGRRANETATTTSSNTLQAAATTGGQKEVKPAREASELSAKPAASPSAQLEDSPLVKADRLDINKMLASLNRTQPLPPPPQTTRMKLRHGLVESRFSLARRKSRLLTEASRRRQKQKFADADGHRGSAPEPALEPSEEVCPKDSFTCANGKCRSTAILCSGVDGCGDNSDENRCEVCQCEPPN